MMKLKATTSKGGGDYEHPEPGNQAAVLIAIVDLGTVEREFEGRAKDMREVYLVWELTTQQMTGSSNNHCVGKLYSLSFGEKSNLRKMIAKWRGKEFSGDEEFEMDHLLGKTCLLDVQPVAGKSYVKLDATPASRLPKGMPCPDAKRPVFSFDLEISKDLSVIPDWLPYIFGEPVPDRIKRSKEFRGQGGKVMAVAGAGAFSEPAADIAEDIPF